MQTAPESWIIENVKKNLEFEVLQCGLEGNTNYFQICKLSNSNVSYSVMVFLPVVTKKNNSTPPAKYKEICIIYLFFYNHAKFTITVNCTRIKIVWTISPDLVYAEKNNNSPFLHFHSLCPKPAATCNYNTFKLIAEHVQENTTVFNTDTKSRRSKNQRFFTGHSKSS